MIGFGMHRNDGRKIMKDEMRLYLAIIWQQDDLPGQRVSVFARSLKEARQLLESEYGAGKVFNLHNEEDAERPR
jgi:hypothetical protein